MKNKFPSNIFVLQLLCTVAILMFIASCEDNSADMRVPVITEVRNYAAAPNDTLITSLNDGQWVVLHGKNLGAVTQVYFGSIAANINRTFLTDESLVVQVPSIPFLSVSKDKLHIITAVSEGGTTNFEINITGAPIIVRVRNYDAEGEITDAIFPDQQINIIGLNLENATSIAFQGVEADLSNVVYTDSSTIVKLPANLSGGDATLANTISYTTRVGTGNFFIKIIGPPIITRVSNEVPEEGTWVYLYGNNLLSVQSLTFAGTEISSFEELEEGSSIKFMVPKLSQSGPVVITTPGGEFTTAYKVNDLVNGTLGTMEWGDKFGWEWWGGAQLHSGNPDSGWPPYSEQFPGNASQYLVMDAAIQDPGDGQDWDGANAVRIGTGQWVPSGNLSDPVSSWALKFEINIPNDWNGGTLNIKGTNGSIMVRYEPWRTSSTATAPYKTSGWQTITIPLSDFRKNDGTGDRISNLTELVGAEGKSNLILYRHNYSSSPTSTGFFAAFDNFRVVKIK